MVRSEEEVATEELNFAKMRVKQLKAFLAERGVECKGCAEKEHFVEKCEASRDMPILPPEPAVEESSGMNLEDMDDVAANMMREMNGDFSHVKDPEKRRILKSLKDKGISMSGSTDMDIDQLRNLEKSLSSFNMPGGEL
eukprot:CAMPEP_0197853522 /NCGR_PEP_ID=MMETSP1438-20131217/22889_1 /TAXON_ID=1461541 /ORGANISM="Pterosperma sp., Strain CCMP1384" /LENGTH=138 /DNA_ID=CAMNT_0043467961 /DNA_START=186 /DNA_END=602 /DNA_ORIENTATION=+